jgi:Ca2+-binding RTX toxin-like protein
MHGRLLRIPAALLLMAFAAAPAVADQTLGLGQAADADGVVTSFTIGGTTAQSVQLRSVQALGGGGTATTATSEPVTATPGQPVAVRVPIAAGGTLTLLGASGAPTVTAKVEGDSDGDGYGDSGQDPCPDDYTDHARPCVATRTVGSPLTLAPDPRGFPGGGNPMQAFQDSAGGVMPLSPATGILTRWRLRSTTASGDTVLQVLRPDQAGTAFTVVAQTAPVHVTSTGVFVLGAGIPIQSGDRLAARSVTGDLGTVAYRSGDVLATHQPPATTIGERFTPDSVIYPDRRLLVQADVEPDADGDGKGDVSQDSADLVLTGSAPAEVGPLDTSTQTYTVRNAGPDKALETAIAFVGNSELSITSDRPGITCLSGDDGAGGTAFVCQLGTLARGEAATIGLGRNTPELVRIIGPVITTRATLTAVTSDPDPTNNAVTLTTTRRPASPPAPPAPPARVVPCANVVRGTRDDDVLRGTIFGDRLVGNDGEDLLKGSAGDDCLEGGAGNDVLDGGDGNDRLDGASGKDRLSGGNGDDRLTGGRGNDVITGGPGKDTISGGDGKDSVNAGTGNDTINSVDGVRETVDCGAGRDTVRADRRDHLVHCEKVTRKR